MVEWWLWRHHLHEIYENGSVYRMVRLVSVYGKVLPMGYYLQGEEYQEFVKFVTELRNIPGNGESTGY